MSKIVKLPASFRDKSGYVYRKGREIYRIVNLSYKENYNFLMTSGLYQELVAANKLIPHKDVSGQKLSFGQTSYKILKPDIIPFISYPYEWSFDMLMSAAQLVLDIQKLAFKYGMTLKDASAFNVQFIGVKPVFIDTLSFEKLKIGAPWLAYRQFCQHFLAPLALMKYKDLEFGKLQKIYLDGIDLNLAVKLLPLKSVFNFHLFLHLHLHGLGQKYFQKKERFAAVKKMSAVNLENLMESLRLALNGLKIKSSQSRWSAYYSDNNYSLNSFENKTQIIDSILADLKPEILADLGSNTGLFSRLAAKYSQYVISVDVDSHCVNENFKKVKRDMIGNLLTIVNDFSNPSPGLGWQNMERDSFLSRLHVNCVLALALIHHLFFTHNLSFKAQAGFFRNVTDFLIVEFIPFADEQVQSLVGLRNSDVSDYSEHDFNQEFSKFFTVLKKYKIDGSNRLIYFMKKK